MEKYYKNLKSVRWSSMLIACSSLLIVGLVFQSGVFKRIQLSQSFLISFVMILLLVIVIGFQIYIGVLKQKWRKALKETVEAEKKNAIVTTTKKLTHDIRKPFTLIQATLPLLENNRSPEKATLIIPKLSKSLNGNLKKVNKTIESLEILGHQNRLKCEPVSLNQIISSALQELTIKKNHFHFSFQTEHFHCSWGDFEKLQLLFVHLFQNAIEAVKPGGKIWLRTSEKGNKISIEIGNSNAYLSEEIRERIFDVFYSDKKPGGLGLGLCIAQKIADSHFSKICVESCKSQQIVTFKFDLSKSDIGDLAPLENKFAERKVSNPKPIPLMAPKMDLSQNLIIKFKRSLEDIVRTRQKPLKLALIDDEEIYRSFLVELINSAELENMLTVEEFRDPEELLSSWNSEYDLLLTDLDLQHPRLDGFELVSKIRQKHRFRGGICIHSNIAYSQNFQKAKLVGANVYLPKPMNIAQLLQFTVGCFPS